MSNSDFITGSESIRWNLDDLFLSPTDPAVDAVLESGKKQALAFVEKYKGKLAYLSADDLSASFRELEAILTPLYKLSQYAHLVYSTDTSDDAVKAFVSRVDDEESEISNELVFFNLELAALPKETMALFLKSPVLAEYRYELVLTQKTAAHNLSEKEEQLLNIKDLTGIDAFRKLYNELSSSFQFEIEIEGEIKKMNGSQLRALRQHENPEVRRRAMATFFERYDENQLIFTTIFNSVVKDFNAERKMRKFPTPISTKLVGKDLEDATIKTLH
ncbi:hypothetical protein EBR96_08695, partial [bacterium]|nr:hypothetical protein [bacterium]